MRALVYVCMSEIMHNGVLGCEYTSLFPKSKAIIKIKKLPGLRFMVSLLIMQLMYTDVNLGFCSKWNKNLKEIKQIHIW